MFNRFLLNGSRKRGFPPCCPVQKCFTVLSLSTCICAVSEQIKMRWDEISTAMSGTGWLAGSLPWCRVKTNEYIGSCGFQHRLAQGLFETNFGRRYVRLKSGRKTSIATASFSTAVTVSHCCRQCLSEFRVHSYPIVSPMYPVPTNLFYIVSIDYGILLLRLRWEKCCLFDQRVSLHVETV